MLAYPNIIFQISHTHLLYITLERLMIVKYRLSYYITNIHRLVVEVVMLFFFIYQILSWFHCTVSIDIILLVHILVLRFRWLPTLIKLSTCKVLLRWLPIRLILTCNLSVTLMMKHKISHLGCLHILYRENSVPWLMMMFNYTIQHLRLTSTLLTSICSIIYWGFRFLISYLIYYLILTLRLLQ